MSWEDQPPLAAVQLAVVAERKDGETHRTLLEMHDATARRV